MREEIRRKALSEHERLLYVAMTRARDRLYICGFHSGNGAAEGLAPESWYSRAAAVLHEIGKSHIDAEGRTIWTHAGFEPGTGEFPAPAEAAATPVPLPAWIDAAPPPEEPDVSALRASPGVVRRSAEAMTPPLPGGAESNRTRGVHVHRLLEALPGLDPEERDSAARRYLAMPGHGLTAAAAADILDSVNAVLGHASFRDAFAPDSLAEVSLVARVVLPDGSEARVAGRIDRLIVREDGILVVDYKTNRPPPADLEGVDSAYVRQLALYRLALEALYPRRAVRAAILWTEALKLMEIPGAAMDRVLHGGVAPGAADLDPRIPGPYLRDEESRRTTTHGDRQGF